jgi:hypothetical protein
MTNQYGSEVLAGHILFNEDPLPEDGSVDQVPSKFRTESYEIPLTLRFGLAWEVINSENMKIVAAADGSHPNDNTEFINSAWKSGCARCYLRAANDFSARLGDFGVIRRKRITAERH